MAKKVGKSIIKFLVSLSPWAFMVASVKTIGWDIAVYTEQEEPQMVKGAIIGKGDFVNHASFAYRKEYGEDCKGK
jgi:hypothetical protein